MFGQSWTALFRAAGKSVALFDPDPAAERRVRDAVRNAWPVLTALGRTGSGAVARARAFYESIGKVTIEVKREVPGHVANRLQAALWREAVHLANEGVATVEDIDTAVSSGPGLRWAVMGPTLLFHLGAGEGGLADFCERYSDSFNRWWDDLGEPHLGQITSGRLVDGLKPITDTHSVDELAAQRDAVLTTIVAATHRDGAGWLGEARGAHRRAGQSG